MFIYSSFDRVKKACLFTLLLTQPMVIQAQPANTSSPAAEAQAQETTAASGGAPQRAYSFPRWPEKSKVQQKRVPPPPPGPYMSTALTGPSLDSPSFTRSVRPEMKLESSSVPIEKFSPDTAWPSSSNASTPGRWKPESGYNYVNPQVKKQPYHAQPNYGYGSRYPSMNWPGSSSSTMPFMRPSVGMDSGRSNYPRPDLSAPNNSVMQYSQPTY